MTLEMNSGFFSEFDNPVTDAPATTLKPSLIAMDRDQLAEALQSIGVPDAQLNMRAKQLWHWLYIRGVKSFEPMLNISKGLREQLEANFRIGYPEICLLYTSPSPRDKRQSRMPSSA